MLCVGGVTSIRTSAVAVTVRAVFPDRPANFAVMTLAPDATAWTWPFDPALSLTDATLAAEVLEVAELVRSCVVRSEYTPVAVSCPFVPCASVGLAGVTLIDTRTAGVMVSVTELDALENPAVIFVVPT